MCRIIAFLLALAHVWSLPAQDQPLSIEWGAVNEKTSTANGILGETADEIVVLASSKGKYYLELYDKVSMKLKKSSPMPIPSISGQLIEPEYIHFFPSTQKIALFTSFYEKKTQTLYQYRIGLDGKVKGKKQLIQAAVQNKQRLGDFVFEPTSDREHLVVSHGVILIKERVYPLQLFVLNSDLEVRTSIKERLTCDHEFVVPESCGFAFDGEQYLHVLVREATGGGLSCTSYDYTLHSYDLADNNSKEVQEIDLDIQHQIKDLVPTIDANQNLALTGMYATSKGFVSGSCDMKGILYLVYDPKAKEITTKKFAPYTDALFERAYGKRAKRFRYGLTGSYDIDQVIPKEGGGLFLICESLEGKLLSYAGNSEKNFTTEYTLEDIQITYLNKAGQIQWIASIPKRQIFTRRNLAPRDPLMGGEREFFFNGKEYPQASFIHCIQNDKLYFVYNDHPSNISADVFKKPKGLQKFDSGVPVLVTIDADGNMVREVMEGAASDELLLRPFVNYHANAQTIYVYGNRRKLDKLGRLTFN